MTKECHECCGGDASECCADADGSNFVQVCRVFMERDDVLGTKSFADLGGEVIVGDVVDQVGKSCEVGLLVTGLISGVCGVVAEEIDGVSKWAGSSPAFLFLKGF